MSQAAPTAMNKGLRLAVARTMLLDRTAVQVVEKLAAAEIPSILLKGPTLAQWLYDDAHPRVYTDVDVLVPPNKVGPAENVLRELGFVCPPDLPYDRPWQAHEWVRAADGAAIDLHRSLKGTLCAAEKLWDVLSQRTITEEIAGRPVSCLEHDARALHIVLHTAAHGPANEKSHEDLRRALQKVPPERWQHIRDLAKELDALTAFASGLRLHPEGAELATRLGLETRATIETVLRASSAVPTARGIEWFFRLPGWKEKIAFLYYKSFPPREFMHLRHPLARRGILGLALAYVWRPLWQLGKLWPALLDYVRARRATRQLRRSSIGGHDPASSDLITTDDGDGGIPG